MDLVVAAYALSDAFPSAERFGLTSQLRRATVSVPANIAEGHARTHRRDFMRFLTIARSSLREADTHVLIAVRVGHVSGDAAAPFLALSDEVGRMLTALYSAIAAREDVPARHASLVTQQTARKNSSQSRIP
jgi:four helix bundle protein